MADEIELKLALPAEQQSRLLRHPLLKQGVVLKRQKVVNVYYDTPELDLHRHRVALRIRRQGEQWLQTVKCAGVSGGGLSTRPEWEVPYNGRFDFSAVDDKKVRRLLQGQASRLLPVFETTFQRTTWRFESAPGKAVLMMLDRGAVKAAGRQEVISELELELAGGSVPQLFALAQTLGQRHALTPALLSKAERGYRLAAGTEDEPCRAASVALDAKLSPFAAFQRIALDCLEQLQHNQQGVIRSSDPEFIHQMRIAARRLRAAMRLFSPCLTETARALLPPLQQLMTALGKARDLDVLLQDTVLPVAAERPRDHKLAALVDHLCRRQQAARQEVGLLLQTPAYGQMLLAFLALLHMDQAEPAGSSQPLLRFAQKRLERLHHRVCRAAAKARADDPVSLHSLRIDIKRLRYSLEFLGPLLQTQKALNKSLTRHQDQLGILNDLANRDALLQQVVAAAPDLASAVRRIQAWHRPRSEALQAGVEDDLAYLVRLPAIKVGKRSL